jgi:uncharacterized protein YecT (DUF1311 family)
MFCRFCGSNLTDDSIFCRSCGKSLAKPVAQTESSTTAPVSILARVSTVTATPKSNGRTMLITVVLAAGALAILVLAVFLKSRGTRADSGTRQGASQTEAPTVGLKTEGKPSFDCAKARTAVEIAICADRELAALEVSMVAAYQRALDRLPTEERADFRRQHLEWFKGYQASCNALAQAGTGDQLKVCISKALSDHTRDLHNISGSSPPKGTDTPAPLTPEELSRLQAIQYWNQAFEIPAIEKASARVFGARVRTFQTYQTGSGGKVSEGILTISCCKPHDCPSFGGVFTFDVNTGKAAGALYNQTEVTVYLGDYASIQETPVALRAEVQRESSSEIFRARRIHYQPQNGAQNPK